MNKIAILGPQKTFTDKAAKEYLERNNLDMECIYYPSIDEVIRGLKSDCKYAIVPIENTLDGYVQRTLDLLLECDLQILDEITIPISFAFVGNADKLSNIKKIFVQFKSNGQCRKFISSLNNPSIITTESNMVSFNEAEFQRKYEGAIIPSHMIEKSLSHIKISNVEDLKNNSTRFIIVKSLQEGTFNSIKSNTLKMPIYVLTDEDKPGMLFKILKIFNDKNINIKCILSRPTKKGIGSYNFYFELEGSISQKNNILEAVSILGQNYNIKILGVY